MRTLELYKYNPDQMSPEELEATFTSREGLVRNILDDLRAGAKAKVNQHFLITGPRGIGKTNLLLMLRYRLQTEKALSMAYVPLKTAEEEYGVTGLRDLLGRMIELLAEATDDHGIEKDLWSIRSIDNEEEAVEACIAGLKKYYHRSNRKIVLLVDNIDLILDEQMTDRAQIGRLRDLLMNEAFMVLVGTAPTFFKEVSGYERPFYNFFKLITLEDLSFQEFLEMLKRRAQWDDNQEILGRLEEIHPRLEAVYHLTGGNPRLALILYQFYTQTALPEVRATLQMLLDDITPYYKHRMERLSPQQRKVMDAFARLGRPATPTELAKETRVKVNQINSILQRLKEDDFVSIAPQKRRKRTLYIVSERIFRIWHQMRFSAIGRRKLLFLIEFIRFWYSEPEWRMETGRLKEAYLKSMQGKRPEDSDRFLDHLDLMVQAAPKPELGYEVEDETIRACIESGDCDRAQKILHKRLKKYNREGNQTRLAETWVFLAYLHYSENNLEEVITAVEKAISIKPDMYEAFYDWANALSDLARRKSGKAQEAMFRDSFDKYEKAIRIKPDMHEAFYNWGNALYDLALRKSGKAQETLLRDSFDKYEKAIRIKPDIYEAFYNWGIALKDLALKKSGRAQEALFKDAFDKCEKAIQIKPDMHEAFYNWGVALSDLALSKSGTDRDNLFELAFKKIQQAVGKVSELGDHKEEAFYWAALIVIALHRCATALEMDNRGEARKRFRSAVDAMLKADTESANRALLEFFRDILKEETARMCAEFLSLLRDRDMPNQVDLLEPFEKAVEYWQRGKDEDVLERLNPEVRQLVEQIIK